MMLVSCKRQDEGTDVAPANERTATTAQSHAEFAAAFVSAVNADDEEKLRALIHSRCLARITEDNEDFYNEVLLQALVNEIPKDYEIDATPIGENDSLPFGEVFDYPIRPTHNLQIRYAVSPDVGASIVQQLALENDRWAIVIPCPSAEALVTMRESKALVENRKARAKELIRELNDPLLSEVKELLEQERTIEAYQRYSEATGETLATAADVLALIDMEEDN